MTSVVLAGGGTAGHTSPLIATAQALELLEPGVQLTCVGTAKGLETRVIPAAGLDLELITPVPLPRKPNLDLARLPFRLTKSIVQARKILKRVHAEVLVGFGGYVSIPAYWAARSLKIPVVVHEANWIPGIANKLGAKFAAYSAITFPGTELPGSKLIGMPMSRSITHATTTPQEARRSFGLDPDKRTLLVSGGSQGALAINEAVAEAAERFLTAGIQILHVLGPKNMTDADVERNVEGTVYKPIAFVEHMADAYAAADMMIARAGAATVMETAVSGLPVVFVPLPWGNGEQARNAAQLVENEGALMISQNDLSADKLVTEILPLMQDPETLARMSAIAREQYPSDAADVLAQAVLDASQK